MSCTCPSADHARQVHCGGSALLFVLITSCLSSSTMILPSRSYMMRRNQQRQSNQSLLTSSKGSMTEVNAPKINYTITYWSRLELRNSLCYHQRIQLALNVTSLPFALVLKCSIDRSWNVKVEVFLPKSWYWGQWRHTASNGWGWSRGHWWCHHCPGYRGACLHSGPTAWPGHPGQRKYAWITIFTKKLIFTITTWCLMANVFK